MNIHRYRFKSRTLFARLCIPYMLIAVCAGNVFAENIDADKENERKQHKQSTQTIKTEKGAPSADKEKPRGVIVSSSDRRENTARESRSSFNSNDARYYTGNYRYDDKRYPKPGYHVRVLPNRYHTSRYRNRDYFFDDGIWYMSYGSEFRVVIAPAGIRVPRLPPVYTTVWHNRRAYYYANSTYYIWEPTDSSYVVVDAPETMKTSQPPLVADDLYVYPAQGQTETQLSDDRYACHAKSRDETQYDPTSPPSGISTFNLSNMRANYLSTMRECLVNLGYSVR